jgi:hypothetical protein
VRPRAADGIPVIRGDESDRRVSRGKLQWFPDDVDADGILTGEYPIRFKDKGYGFFEVRPGFVKGRPLRIGARQFLDIRNVSAGYWPKHSGELNRHGAMIPPTRCGV